MEEGQAVGVVGGTPCLGVGEVGEVGPHWRQAAGVGEGVGVLGLPGLAVGEVGAVGVVGAVGEALQGSQGVGVQVGLG